MQLKKEKGEWKGIAAYRWITR